MGSVDKWVKEGVGGVRAGERVDLEVEVVSVTRTHIIILLFDDRQTDNESILIN